ncbi:MAG: bifunctional diaminohydroxyphosphoribosylaminopyrimidine deaminase/5-amino-6-(5-phosphoribosylamino)uracil reductase RibD [Burkholderiales bacterium]|nr:bifunctional diaminohydroxyphosphoribosylaminopyrimidine deaminase/5-amino-6-(5-phosphoribosylamino)uracil reductase RibD [Burkholderiales bacterium]
MFSAEDHAFMARALKLTENGRLTATPNPSVGCVIVKNGRIIGEGWHAKPGEGHAEVQALSRCEADPAGATVYVTLEPCAHHGRTPPCAEALIKAGVARVVAAIEDPYPLVAGKGLEMLRAANIRSEAGLLADEARRAHRGFLSRVTRGRPWVTVKLGASLDGRTALKNGASRWITSAEARRDVHALRARSCAVLTGIGTVLADNPALTVRDVPCTRQPLKVLLDSRLEVADDAKLLDGGNALIVTATGDEGRVVALRGRGIRVERVATESIKGKVDLAVMMQALGKQGLNEVMVETGGRLNGSLIQAGVVDEIVTYVAPSLLGDLSLGMFAFGELTDLANRTQLRFTDVRSIGPDIRITATVETR